MRGTVALVLGSCLMASSTGPAWAVDAGGSDYVDRPVAVTGSIGDCERDYDSRVATTDCAADFSDPRLSGRYRTELVPVSDCYPPLVEGAMVCLGSFTATLEGPDGRWGCYEIILDLRGSGFGDDDNIGYCRGEGTYTGLLFAYRRSMTIVAQEPDLAYRGVLFEGTAPDWVP